jgi:all-trans-retinol 13,14-reductase
VLNYYENGSSYPSTSPQDMSLGMVREIFRHGGACVCGVKVNELVVTNSKVLGIRYGKKNTLIRADRVINAAGIWVLNNQLLPKDHPATKEFQEITSQPNACQPSMGHFYVFLCLKGSPQELNLDQTNLWCLNDLNKGAIDPCYTNFFEDPESNEVPATYITFPCAKESHWSERWQGISNCILFCDAPYEWFEDWKDSKHTSRPDDYIEFKNMLENKLLNVFYEKCPQLKDKIIWVQSATPLSSEHYLNAFRGADYGSRVDVNYFSKESHKYLMTPETYFTNLFQAGQDAFTPSISGAMHGGILCALRMLTPMEKVEFVKNVIRGLYDEHQTDNPKDGIYKNGLRTIKSL